MELLLEFLPELVELLLELEEQVLVLEILEEMGQPLELQEQQLLAQLEKPCPKAITELARELK